MKVRVVSRYQPPVAWSRFARFGNGFTFRVWSLAVHVWWPEQSDAALVRQLRGAVARGWCDDRNCLKEMDSDLAESIVKEILLSLASDCHPSRALPLRRII